MQIGNKVVEKYRSTKRKGPGLFSIVFEKERDHVHWDLLSKILWKKRFKKKLRNGLGDVGCPQSHK